MSEYQPEQGFAAISQVESYWEALRAGRLLPDRADVDSRGLEQAIAHAFIIERIATGIARLRVAGRHLGDLMGMEVRGMPLSGLIAPAHRKTLATLLEETFQMPATATLELAAPAGPGRAPLRARMILLPLKSDMGDVSRALGCLVSLGDIGRGPRRFDIAAQRVVALTPGPAPVGLPRPAPPPLIAREGGFAEPRREFTRPEKSKRPPYLRVVTSED